MSASIPSLPVPLTLLLSHRHLDVGDINEALMARRRQADRHADRIRHLQSRKARGRSIALRG